MRGKNPLTEIQWRMPDEEELELMCKILYRNCTGFFMPTDYWSGTDGHISTALYVSFSEMKYFRGDKSRCGRIRLVRTFNFPVNILIGDRTATGYVFWKDGQGKYKECKLEDEIGLYSWDAAMKKFGGKK